MSRLLDSSVLIAALLPKEHLHDQCLRELSRPQVHVYIHALNEVFSTLTGGRLGYQIAAKQVARMIRQHLLSRVSVIALSEEEIMEAQEAAERCGVRGGAIYDYMHFVAAKKAGVEAIVTLNTSDFTHLVRSRKGDPEIRLPD